MVDHAQEQPVLEVGEIVGDGIEVMALISTPHLQFLSPFEAERKGKVA
jgi:hypothetical protein